MLGSRVQSSQQRMRDMAVEVLSDGGGRPVDWWFVYKLPKGIGPDANTNGDEFLYCDSRWNSQLQLSKNRLSDKLNPVTQTLRGIFSADDRVGYVLWNDEIPPTRANPRPSNNHNRGHSKGVLAFCRSTNSGLYLLHSTPRFPMPGSSVFPGDECAYGQTFLCVSLNYATTVEIAEILRTHHEPQIYSSKITPAESNTSLAKLAHQDVHSSHDRQAFFTDYPFRSKDRNLFRLFAKNRCWSEPNDQSKTARDYWNHLVGPALRDSIDVETWRRGEVFENVVSGTNLVTLDVLGMNLAAIGYPGYQWPFTKDHAKWGSTQHRPAGLLFRHPGYVVIADINRDETQAKRSGGGIAFQHDGIWRALKSVEKVETSVHRHAYEQHRDERSHAARATKTNQSNVVRRAG